MTLVEKLLATAGLVLIIGLVIGLIGDASSNDWIEAIGVVLIILAVVTGFCVGFYSIWA